LCSVFRHMIVSVYKELNLDKRLVEIKRGSFHSSLKHSVESFFSSSFSYNFLLTLLVESQKFTFLYFLWRSF